MVAADSEVKKKDHGAFSESQMNNLGSRVAKIEGKIGSKGPKVIVVFSDEEKKQKVTEFERNHPPEFDSHRHILSPSKT